MLHWLGFYKDLNEKYEGEQVILKHLTFSSALPLSMCFLQQRVLVLYDK